MLCLHGKPALTKSTVTFGKDAKKRISWFCPECPMCFYCFEEEKPLYDKAIKAFLATKQDRPKCCAIIHPAKASEINRYWKNRPGPMRRGRKRLIPGSTAPYLGPVSDISDVSLVDARRGYAEFMVYTGKEQYKYWKNHYWWTAKKEDIGRPFFMCRKTSEYNPGCGFFAWGDKTIDTKPLCHHGKPCRVDGKDGVRFFGCNQRCDERCAYFEVITPKD